MAALRLCLPLCLSQYNRAWPKAPTGGLIRAATMHGRLKLQPPDAARRKQRQEKLQLYQEGMEALKKKRAGSQLDEEVLELTASILAANPEVGTCWNLRRQALPPEPDWLEQELAFVGRCLTKSPKSYGAWHHRSWVLSHAPGPRPNPAHRQLCDWLLNADPRNFHAWEHRRQLGEEPQQELLYTGQLLGQDFSNFSAWHHRRRLLAGGGAQLLGPDWLQQELRLLHSALFTDPSDLSPWLYFRCLLSRASPLPPPPKLLCLYASRGRLGLSFSRPIRVGPGLEVSLEGSPLTGDWISGAGPGRPAHTWLLEFPPSLAPPTAHFRVTWEGDSTPREVILEPEASEGWWQEPIRAEELLWPEVGVASREVLQQQAETCQELRELEPGSRGCLLTLVLLLWALDPMGKEKEIRECLRELKEVDPLRRGFLLDVEAKVEVGVALLRAGPGEEVNLEGKALMSLPFLHHLTLVPSLRLGRNQLAAVPQGAWPRLQELDLSHNRVRSLQGAPPLPALRWLSLEGNPIGHASDLAPLAACPHLAELRLAETPLAAAPDAASRLAELLPGVQILLS